MTAGPVQRLYTASPSHHTALVKVIATLFLSAALTLGAGSRALAEPEDLPDIGSPAQAMLTLEDEYQIGRMIVRGLRDQDQILEDPEVTEYIRSLLRFRPDVVPTLRTLRARGFRTGLISICSTEVQEVVACGELAPLLDVAVYSSRKR